MRIFSYMLRFLWHWVHCCIRLVLVSVFFDQPFSVSLAGWMFVNIIPNNLLALALPVVVFPALSQPRRSRFGVDILKPDLFVKWLKIPVALSSSSLFAWEKKIALPSGIPNAGQFKNLSTLELGTVCIDQLCDFKKIYIKKSNYQLFQTLTKTACPKSYCSRETMSSSFFFSHYAVLLYIFLN